MFDRYADIQLEPPSHATAREQLAKAKIKVLEGSRGIVQVNPEAILFLNEFGRVMTAWSQAEDAEKVVFQVEAGMPAWPS